MSVTISNQRLGLVGFVEAPTASGRISTLETKWISGDVRLFRAINPFLQVPPPLGTRQTTITTCRYRAGSCKIMLFLQAMEQFP